MWLLGYKPSGRAFKAQDLRTLRRLRINSPGMCTLQSENLSATCPYHDKSSAEYSRPPSLAPVLIYICTFECAMEYVNIIFTAVLHLLLNKCRITKYTFHIQVYMNKHKHMAEESVLLGHGTAALDNRFSSLQRKKEVPRRHPDS
jgi:hypothetical protein